MSPIILKLTSVSDVVFNVLMISSTVQNEMAFPLRCNKICFENICVIVLIVHHLFHLVEHLVLIIFLMQRLPYICPFCVHVNNMLNILTHFCKILGSIVGVTVGCCYQKKNIPVKCIHILCSNIRDISGDKKFKSDDGDIKIIEIFRCNYQRPLVFNILTLWTSFQGFSILVIP